MFKYLLNYYEVISLSDSFLEFCSCKFALFSPDHLLNFFVAHSLYEHATFAQRIFSENSGSILSKWIRFFYALFKIQGKKTAGESLINDQQWNVSLLCPRGTQRFTKSCHLPPGQALRTLVLDVPCLVNTSALQSTGPVWRTGFLFKTFFSNSDGIIRMISSDVLKLLQGNWRVYNINFQKCFASFLQ